MTDDTFIHPPFIPLSDADNNYMVPFMSSLPKRKKEPIDGKCEFCKYANWEKNICRIYLKKNPYYQLHPKKECESFKLRKIHFKWLKILLLKIVYNKRFIADNEYFELMELVLPEDDEK